MIDQRLNKLSTDTMIAIAVEVMPAEAIRMVMAQEHGAPFLPPIRRKSHIFFLCRLCHTLFTVRADVAVDRRFRCPSPRCPNRHAH